MLFKNCQQSNIASGISDCFSKHFSSVRENMASKHDTADTGDLKRPLDYIIEVSQHLANLSHTNFLKVKVNK